MGLPHSRNTVPTSPHRTQAVTAEPRLQVDVHVGPDEGSTLADDVLRGLSKPPYRLPPKHFYDARGSDLFDAICDTEEYYPTRTEAALLASVAPTIMELAAPHDLVELGSGAARKTRLLLDAMARSIEAPRYLPFDVSESMLRRSANELLQRYPTLRVHGVVGDYERHLGRIPHGTRRLFAFLGSTIGNFENAAATRFLRDLASTMHGGDSFLLGVDLVKDTATLERAYNDAQGLTAAFNRNVLQVINRELAADFAPEQFEHVAFFNRDASQIEMHLHARNAHTVHIEALKLAVPFARGEGIHTEISRKFTDRSTAALLREAGMTMVRWFPSSDRAFALALAVRSDD